jgi:predicted dehydrogenase
MEAGAHVIGGAAAWDRRMQPSLHVAIVGLGFGAEFVPIHLHHPLVREVTVCDADPALRRAVRERFGAQHEAESLERILADPGIDAVHLVTPIPRHAAQAVAVLRSGKHCACTVPAATSLEDLHALVRARRESGRVYMMMETAVYTREFLMVEEWHRRGELGRIQFLRGAHYQDMEGWPSYWAGLPPMHYATHAVAPLLRLAATRATRVRCLGSGTMRPELRAAYGNPFPVETAQFELAAGDAVAEVTRSLFETARSYTEAFTVLGSEASFEWQQLEKEDPLRFSFAPGDHARGRRQTAARVAAPDRADRLPEAIRRFTTRGVYDATNAHRSFTHGGGHGGSHPHLVHEFLSAIAEGRESAIDAVTAAEWTAAGICAHHSAQRGGEPMAVPDFSQAARKLGDGAAVAQP